ncbi:hypothetical protein RRG08_008053 [Elysia crispata]|uniref:PH domain-containing protein n=1 Tax=Elysia crispata TaxID=231223 RepID=A0AAE1E108_9GAST|nr:hypothetical protein RRG08_008053 [Elysia crispata]
MEFEAKEEAKLQKSKAPSPRSIKPSPMEGQILKFTNVMKGFQYRWFVLDPDSGMLEYFEKEEYKKQRPRGSVHLAVVLFAVEHSEWDSEDWAVCIITSCCLLLNIQSGTVKIEPSAWSRRVVCC